ncbi:hypothetical protein A4A49_20295, partial [Nicotiana attenuata]
EGVEKESDQSGDKGVECAKVVDGNRAGVESTAVNVTGKKGSGDAGQNYVSGASVPVAEALARVVQDLMTTKNTMLDRGLSGESKDAAIESGQLQLMMDDSTLATSVRAIFDKNNAAVAELGQLDKVKKQPSHVGSQLEASATLNTTGRRPNDGLIKTTVAQDTAIQDEEQQIEDGDASCSAAATGVEPVVGHLKARQEQTNNQQVQGEKKKGTGIVEASALETAGDTAGGLKPTVTLDFEASKFAAPTGSKVLNVKDNSIAKDVGQVLPRQSATAPNKSNINSSKWTVVNKSTSKKQSTGVQNQIVPSNVHWVLNSFDAFVNEGEHVTKEAENREQQMGEGTRSIGGNTSSTGNEKQQINAEDIGARLVIATGDNHTGEASQVPDVPISTMNISNTDLTKMVENAQAAMMMNTTPKNGQPQAPGSNTQQQTSKNTGGRLIISKDIVPVDV